MVILIVGRAPTGPSPARCTPTPSTATAGSVPHRHRRGAGSSTGPPFRRAQGIRLGWLGADRHRGHLQRGEHLPRPESRNARITMVMMAPSSVRWSSGSPCGRGHPPGALSCPAPRRSSPRSASSSTAAPLGQTCSTLLQIGTTLILILAANTSFTGFPVPGQLRRRRLLPAPPADQARPPPGVLHRDHRRSPSAVGRPVVITGARVDRLIPLYAIGVFTGFTMAGAGWPSTTSPHREDQLATPVRHQRHGGRAVVRGDVIIVVTKFTEGAWVILVILPLGVSSSSALHRQYVRRRERSRMGHHRGGRGADPPAATS